MCPLSTILSAAGLASLLCGLALAQVTINEVMIDDQGDDDSSYVELNGPAGTPLDGWTLVGVNGSNGQDYATISLNGQAIPAGGFFVIGQSSNVPNVDLVNSLVNFQNGPDNIQLRQGTTIVDAIGYGAFTGSDTCFRGEGQPCPDQDPGVSLSRFPDGHDTNNNADDFHLTAYLTPGTANLLSGSPVVYTLSYLRTHQNELMNQPITVNGIAACPSNLFGGTGSMSAYMQDSLAGINLYGGSFSFTTGDCLRVTGTLNQYNSLLEVASISQLNIGPTVGTPDSILITCQIANENGESLESMLIHIEDAWITETSPGWPNTGVDSNLIISDASGADLVVRVDKDTDLDGWSGHPTPGQHFNLTAILSQYGSTYQVLPRCQLDFQIIAAVAPRPLPGSPAEFRLESPAPNPFNPVTTVIFGLDRPGRATLEAFALNGSRIATIMAGTYAAGSYQTVWNAGDLPSGLYLLRLTSGANVSTVKAILVK